MINFFLNFIFIFLTVSGCSHNLPSLKSELSLNNLTENKVESIGDYSLGCLRGAQTFTGKEKGVVLAKNNNGNFWGHPVLINLLTRMGAEFDKSNQNIIIGDLSQKLGGPILGKHKSHQTGLEVDVWFRILSNNDKSSLKITETDSMNVFKELGVDQIKLIKYLAQDATVDRIFINPVFKKQLCDDNGPSKLSISDQGKIRAYWRQDSHTHVVLKCPQDSPLCISLTPLPEGGGCGGHIKWWLNEEAKAGMPHITTDEAKSSYLEKIKKLPPQCSFLKETL